MKKILIALTALLVATMALAGCDSSSKYGQQFQDAGVSGQNKAKAIVGTMPDGFSNFAAKCDGQNMVYVIFKSDNTYGSIAVVPNDPRC